MALLRMAFGPAAEGDSGSVPNPVTLMSVLRLAVLCALLVFGPRVLAGEQQPIQKLGTCPLGYFSSGQYCVPTSKQSKPVIEKYGTCPVGFYSAGNYCRKSQ